MAPIVLIVVVTLVVIMTAFLPLSEVCATLVCGDRVIRTLTFVLILCVNRLL